MKRIARGLLASAVILFSLFFVAGCGDDDGRSVGPGLVGVDNRPLVTGTDPQLSVEYTRPGIPGTFQAIILSDPPTSGDIASDPVLGNFTITTAPDTLFFGIDLASPNRPEYRAFLDFPLDGSTGGAAVPLDADVSFAQIRIFINSVEFFETVPVRLDLVSYPITTGLATVDFDSAPLATRDPFNIFIEDAGFFVDIEVTSLMRAAQIQALADFQVRFLVL